MAGTTLLALIDDIASTLDDVAILTKIAAKKTSGVLGDDLALNAQQVSGINADRELPVVWAVAKGSVINKMLLVPSALLISQILPILIMPLLTIGGAYLCFEGFEKVFEKLFHKNSEKENHRIDLITDTKIDVVEFEKTKIKGAIRTDFILSAEIVVITLGTVASETLAQQTAVLASVALLMTIGVYGLVALIVKFDDLGLYLIRTEKAKYQKTIGKMILRFAPFLMKSLGVIGTIAMFLVGGGIIAHNISLLHHLTENLNPILSTLSGLIIGLCSGALVFIGAQISKKIFTKT